MKCPGDPAARGVSSEPTLASARTGRNVPDSGPRTSSVTVTSASVPSSSFGRAGVSVTVVGAAAASGVSAARALVAATATTAAAATTAASASADLRMNRPPAVVTAPARPAT